MMSPDIHTGRSLARRVATRTSKIDTAAHEAAHEAALLRHRVINARSLLRCKSTHPALRARLEVLVPELERECAERGLDPRGRRPFVDRSGGGSLTFGISVSEGPEVRHHTPPFPTWRRPKKRDDDSSALDGGQMLDAVMAELDQRMR